jgi:hypothetical protein
MRRRWLAAAGAFVVVVALAGVAAPALVHTPSATVPLAAADETTVSVSTTSTVPATVPEATTVAPATGTTTPTTATSTTATSTTATSTTVAPVVTDSAIGNQALALISYPWTKLGYTLAFHGPRAGFYGLTDCHAHTIDIYVTPSQTVVQVAYITAFEIGHAIDCAHLTDGHQTSWPVARGFHLSGSWFPSCSCSEDNFASGDFSEVFARWQVGPAYAWRSNLAPAPTAAQLAALIPLFA